MSFYICKECFYKYRCTRLVQCPHNPSTGNGVFVKWNGKGGRLETTERSIRPIPTHLPAYVNNIVMCDPKTCRKDECMYAHGQEEQREWNRILSSQKVPRTSQEVRNQVLPSPFPAMNRERHGNYAAMQPTFEERVKEDLDITCIKEELAHTNYKKKFHNLICWEEKRHIEILKEKCDGVHTVVFYEAGYRPSWTKHPFVANQRQRYGYIQGLNGDQIAYALQASEGALLVEPNRSAEEGRFDIRVEMLEGDCNYTDGKIYIVFDENAYNSRYLYSVLHLRELPRHKVTVHHVFVEFEVKHSYFNNLTKSVTRINESIIAKLFPTQDDMKPLKACTLPSTTGTDKYQSKALQAILSAPSGCPPIVINGSFGTGKTHLLASAAEYLLAQGRGEYKQVEILICAHHQASADHIAELLQPSSESFTLIRLVSKLSYKKPKYFHDFDSAEKMCHAITPPSLSYLVIVTTFLTSPSISRFKKGSFTHIMLDEGSQTREPEVIAPLCLADNKTRIILAGDSCQVGPSLLVLGEEARKHGMKTSLLERLQVIYNNIGDRAKEYMLSLDVNYRCHKDIIAIPKELFYSDSIIPSAMDAKTHPHAPFPLVFVCSSLTHKVDLDFEARLLLDEASKYISPWPKEWGGRQMVCVVTPSITQLIKTRHMVHEKQRKYLQMLTTYRIQGREFRALFMSTTEPVDAKGNTTNPTKSPCDPYVFNTVLTRAKSLVVVVGSPLALLGIEKHMIKLCGRKGKCWSLYLKHCIENKTLVIPAALAKTQKEEKSFMARLKSDLGIKPSNSVPSSRSPATLNRTHATTGRSVATPSSTRTTMAGTERSAATPSSTRTTMAGTERSAATPSSTRTVMAGTERSLRTTVADTRKLAATPDVNRKSTDAKRTGLTSVNKSSADAPITVAGPPASTLTVQNYKERFHHLLNVEEREHERQLAARCAGKEFTVTIQYDEPYGLQLQHEGKHGGERYAAFGFISSDDDDTLAFVKQATEESLITLGNGSCIEVKHVTALKYLDICIALTSKDVQTVSKWKKIDQEITFKGNIQFKLKHGYFGRLRESINGVAPEVVQKLIPTPEMLNQCIRSFKQHSSGENLKPAYRSLHLDHMQLQALDFILHAPPVVPLLVAGPFGTGKTRLLARAAYEILQKKGRRVLICVHHQASADAFMDYFGEMKKGGWRCSIQRVTPNPFYRLKRKEYKEYYTDKRHTFDCSLTVTTLGTAPYMRIAKQGYFTDILIDEGAQAREPETIGPLCYADESTRIIIAGDHCQVGPRLLVLGDEAQRGGLGVSLLERLHHLYNNLNSSSRAHSVTLLTNYRCHNGILMLPSSLYYQSTLQCRVSDDIAHHLAPFPLKFVCSDLTDTNVPTSGSNAGEANALIAAIEDHFSTWPKHWGEEDYGQICIMSPSPTQCALFRRYKPKRMKDIEILPAYDIQGRQYRAIFLSTSELTTCNGEPLNQTKSISDRYVFNTAITRSQSLVVAVGNPFLLLKIEANMMKKYGSEAECWSPYIKQCIECNTFSLTDELWKQPAETEQAMLNLLGKIYLQPQQTLAEPKSLDSIIKLYKKVFSGIRECKRAKVILATSKDSRLSWKIDDPEDTAQEQRKKVKYEDKYLCILKADSHRKAEAVPIDSRKRVVQIQGAYNRKGAFDGEKVMVGVFKGNPAKNCYGRVVEVPATSSRSDLKFMCRVCQDNPIIFYPIDRKNPSLINMPRLSRDLILKKEGVNYRDIIEDHLKSNDVVVFDPDSLASDKKVAPLPQIKQVIPISVARNMVFNVAFVKWDSKYRSPLGIVIGVYPKGHTPFHAERLLKYSHSVEYDDEPSDEFEDFDSDPVVLPHAANTRVFTIDPDGAQNLDDALSLTKLKSDEIDSEVYELSVHIVNAAKHILPSTDDDKLARTRGTSVYGVGKGKVMHMLPSKTRCLLSLTPGRIRDVLSVTWEIVIKKGVITIGNANLSSSCIRSAIQLTYEEAQQVLKDGEISASKVTAMREFDNDPQNPTLQETLELLHDIAQVMCQKRLKSDAAYSYTVSEEDSLSCWQTHMLVEELMIWANSEVAKKMHSVYPDTAIVRRQGHPNQEELAQHIKENETAMSHSLYLSRFVEDRKEMAFPFIIPHYALEQIRNSLASGDKVLLSNLLGSDRLYPQLSTVHSKLHLVYPRAEYCCTEGGQIDPDTYRHSSLCLDYYTHFTSPLRRYADIEVQRMLLELFDTGLRRNYSREDHVSLCHSLNNKNKNASEFEKSSKSVNLTFGLTSSSEIYIAFVSEASSNRVELTFPQFELSHIPLKERRFNLHHLGPFSKKMEFKTSGPSVYKWNARITSLQSDYAASILQIPSLSVSRRDSTSERASHNIVLNAFKISDPSTLCKEELYASQPSPVVEIPPALWLEMMEFVKNPTDERMVEMRKTLPNLPLQPARKSPVLDGKEVCFHIDCDMMHSLKQSDVLKVWMTWSVREYVISPAIQLVELSPLLRICVQHNSHPAECFSDPNLKQASKAVYASIEEYIDLWKAVLLAEAAEKSVKECQPVIIRDVHLEWPNLVISKKCLDQHYYVPARAVVMVFPAEFVSQCYEYFKVSIGDLVCVRYGCDPHHQARAVFHFVVHRVVGNPNKEDRVEIQMECIGDVNCQVSEKMKLMLASNTYAEVQLITLSSSYRRVFSGLLELGKNKSSRNDDRFTASHLSRCVAQDYSTISSAATKSDYKICNKILNSEDEFIYSISKWNQAIKSLQKLNHVQVEAMRLAVRNSFQLIQGPPGTGKSETGAHIAYVFARLNWSLNGRSSGSGYKCVLYCGPSNKSVDVVLKKFDNLARTRNHPNLKILRIFSRSVETKDYPGPSPISHGTDYECPHWAKTYALHHILRKCKRKEREFIELSSFEKKFHDLRGQGSIPSGTLCNQYRRTLSKAEEIFLSKERFDIIFCTCNEASGDRVRRNLSPHQCIIDECGMAYEPETVVPISLCEHTVLIGDHMQLQPVIDHRQAKNCGLSTSLFERYANTVDHHLPQHKQFTFTLEEQYRMHKEICQFPSKEFYNGKLVTAKSVIERKNPETKLEGFWPRGQNCPIVFINLVGKEEETKIGSEGKKKIGTDSKFNTMEAKKAVEIARVLHRDHGVPVEEIAILTPYSAQKDKIQKESQATRDIRKLKVASINESQGDEYGIIILSTVRTLPCDEIRNPLHVQADRSWLLEHLGFITDKHQINVGITRSKYGLVIIGNQMLLRYDDTWKHLLDHYKEKKCIVDAHQFPRKS